MDIQPTYAGSNHTSFMLTTISVYPVEDGPGEEDCRLEKQVWDLLGKEFLGPVCLGYVLGRCECGGHVHLALQTFHPVGKGETR